MKIGFDIDSTLNTLDEAWCAWIMANHDPDFTLDRWLSWDIHKLTPAGPKVFDFLKIPGVFRHCGVRNGARELLARLARDDHELFAVSSCDPVATWPEKYEWLEEHFPMIPKQNRIACSRKGLLKLDILVDDGPHNFAGFDGLPIIFDQPWNRQYAGARAHSFDGVRQHIDRAEAGYVN